jgi:hypothetical protein
MSVYSREVFVAVASVGGQREMSFFWAHTPPPDAGSAPGPWVLSQWYPAGFDIDGTHYRTAEHWMMAEKARLFGDAKILAAILAAPHPADVKKLGRRVRGFDEEWWNEHRVDVVTRGNRAKFGQHPPLRDWLVATAPKVLVEASPHDRVWGIGLPAEDPRARDPRAWLGENLLGFTLMRVRDELAAAS